MTLVEFLKARLDEDENDWLGCADAGEPGPWSFLVDDIESKRRIVDEVAAEATGLDMQVDNDRRVGPRDEVSEPHLGDKLLRLLALPYSGHDDYRPEWRV